MGLIKVTLTEIVDTSFPAIGAFEFGDISGDVVVIHEKLPVVGIGDQDMELNVPMDAELVCNIVSEVGGIVQIDLSEPHGISDIQGRSQFKISAELVIW